MLISLAIAVLSGIGAFCQEIDRACSTSVETDEPGPFQALLQVRTLREPTSLGKIEDGSIPVMRMSELSAEGVEMRMSELSAEGVETKRCGGPTGLGATASLDEQGFLEVAKTCCSADMLSFIRRTIEFLDMEVCVEAGLLGLAPWFTCGIRGSDFSLLQREPKFDATFAELVDNLKRSQAPEECYFVAPINECIPWPEPMQEVCDQRGNYSATAFDCNDTTSPNVTTTATMTTTIEELGIQVAEPGTQGIFEAPAAPAPMRVANIPRGAPPARVANIPLGAPPAIALPPMPTGASVDVPTFDLGNDEPDDSKDPEDTFDLGNDEPQDSEDLEDTFDLGNDEPDDSEDPEKLSPSSVTEPPNSSTTIVPKDDGPTGIGSTAPLDEEGFLQVAQTCCAADMLDFVNRTIMQLLDCDICMEGGLLGIVPWFTCSMRGYYFNFTSKSLLNSNSNGSLLQTGTQNISQIESMFNASFHELVENLRKSQPPEKCFFLAPKGSCNLWPRQLSEGCYGEENKTAFDCHRTAPQGGAMSFQFS